MPQAKPPRKKASAPRVKKGGYDAAADRLARAAKALKVTVPGTDVEPFAVALANIPSSVRRRIRAETGKPLEAHTAEDAGLDTYVLLWWVSRLVDGENIALILADDEWSDRCAGIRVGDLETEWITLHDGSDQEADPAGEAPGQPD